MIKLGVNIDHVATIRQARGGVEPNLTIAAKMAGRAGADSITVHLREDRRHINDNDAQILSKIIKTRLNLEMAATQEMQKIALEILPYSVCLVPEKREELTTEGGLDVLKQKDYLKNYIKPLQDKGILISLFIDPSAEQVMASFDIGSEIIELHTGQYANNFGAKGEDKSFKDLLEAAKLANSLGLTVNAGHGLNYQNVGRILSIPNLYEFNIGHTIVSRAVFVGLEKAVREMKALIS